MADPDQQPVLPEQAVPEHAAPELPAPAPPPISPVEQEVIDRLNLYRYNGALLNTTMYFEMQKNIVLNALKPNHVNIMFMNLLLQPVSKLLILNIGAGYNGHKKIFKEQFNIHNVDGVTNINYVLIDPVFNENMTNDEFRTILTDELNLVFVSNLTSKIWHYTKSDKPGLNIYFVGDPFFMGTRMTETFSQTVLYQRKLDQFKRLIDYYKTNSCIQINNSLGFLVLLDDIRIYDGSYFFIRNATDIKHFLNTNYTGQQNIILTHIRINDSHVEPSEMDLYFPREPDHTLRVDNPLIIIYDAIRNEYCIKYKKHNRLDPEPIVTLQNCLDLIELSERLLQRVNARSSRRHRDRQGRHAREPIISQSVVMQPSYFAASGVPVDDSFIRGSNEPMQNGGFYRKYLKYYNKLKN